MKVLARFFGLLKPIMLTSWVVFIAHLMKTSVSASHKHNNGDTFIICQYHPNLSLLYKQKSSLSVIHWESFYLLPLLSCRANGTETFLIEGGHARKICTLLGKFRPHLHHMRVNYILRASCKANPHNPHLMAVHLSVPICWPLPFNLGLWTVKRNCAGLWKTGPPTNPHGVSSATAHNVYWASRVTHCSQTHLRALGD